MVVACFWRTLFQPLSAAQITILLPPAAVQVRQTTCSFPVCFLRIRCWILELTRDLMPIVRNSFWLLNRGLVGQPGCDRHSLFRYLLKNASLLLEPAFLWLPCLIGVPQMPLGISVSSKANQNLKTLQKHFCTDICSLISS